jgi:predicted nuclease of predicted toxin-antitoxin system
LSFRFQADADLNPEIGRGLRRREPAIDFRAAAGMIADGTPDSEVLQIAADDDRVLISRDVTTMPGHFARFVAQHESPWLPADPIT